MGLSGTTRVQRTTAEGRSHGTLANNTHTLAKMWENWHLGVYSEWDHPANGKRVSRRFFKDKSRKVWVRSFDEATEMPVISKVRDVVKNGVSPTCRVVTASGKEIRVTLAHRFFTPKGWKRLSELAEGDYSYRQGRVAIATTRPIPPRLREGIGIWTQWMRDELIPYNGAECYLCNQHYKRSELELDHVVPVTTDLELALSKSNLRPACKACHRRKSNSEQGLQLRQGSRMGLRPDQIMSISDPVDEETYELVLDDPHHNFVAEGLIVHSSGFSSNIQGYLG